MPDTTPERLWVDPTSEDALGMFIASRTDEYLNMDVEYVRVDPHVDPFEGKCPTCGQRYMGTKEDE